MPEKISTPTNSPSIEPKTLPKKSNKLRQTGVGAIAGLLTLFIPFYPVLYALQLWLRPEVSFIPGVIITGLLVIIIMLLTRKHWPAFAYTYLIISLIVLAFITFLFQSLQFT